MERTIRFYRVNERYGCFSNFSPHPIVLDGRTWPTSEHYFQAQKFTGSPEDMELIRTTPAPGSAAALGRERTRPLRADWEQVKDDVMRAAVLAKFSQHDDIRAVLLGTRDAYLVEHTTNDAYWGDGGDGKGRNMLGRILMETRETLRDGC